MTTQTKTTLYSMMAALGVSLMTDTASAVPERLDTIPYAPPTPTDPSNAGDATVINWLQAVVDQYNLTPGPNAPLPAVGATAIQAANNGVDPDGPGPFPGYGAGVLSITLPVGVYDYLALRWGGSPTADNWQAFYLGNETGTYTFTAPGQNGLSDYRFYNPRETRVPEAGSSLLLLGMGLCGLAGIATQVRKP